MADELVAFAQNRSLGQTRAGIVAEALDDPQPEVRSYARKALKRIDAAS